MILTENLQFGRKILGMIGGLLGVLLIKRHLGIKKRYENVLDPSIALGACFAAFSKMWFFF